MSYKNISLKRLTADGTIGRQAGGPTKIGHLSLSAAAGANASVDIYDDEVGTGTVIATITALAGTTVPLSFEGCIVLRSRGYANLTGAGAVLNVGLV